MKNRKRVVAIIAGVMAAVMVLTLVFSLIPITARASSSEIRKQINELKKEKEEIKKKIEEVKGQYQENENEIADIIAKKNVIEQEVQLLNTQIININEQIASFNTLIADKQDELDNAESRYLQMNEENKERIRTMEEEGELTYWEVLFKANSFSDLLDRLNMVEEIAAADARHLKEMSDAAAAVEEAQAELAEEKADLEETKQELDATQVELDGKREEALALFQELLSKADDLEAMEEEFHKQDEEFLEQIRTMEIAYTAAKQAEWAAYMATMTEATQATQATQPNGGTGNTGSSGNTGDTGNTGNTGNTGSTGGGSSGWVWPCSARRISSPFGYRTAPTSGASTYHQGIDIDGNTGDPVWAVRAGIVSVGHNESAGHFVRIDHQDGFSSIYMHLDTVSVTSGSIVSARQTIGTMGASGRTTGDHLHLGIYYNGVPLNPCAYVS